MRICRDWVHFSGIIVVYLLFLLLPVRLFAQTTVSKDTSKLYYPFSDAPLTKFKQSHHPLYLWPNTVQREVIYDVNTQQYIIQEKLGDFFLRPPLILGQEEFKSLEFERAKKEFWQNTTQQQIHKTKQEWYRPAVEINSPTFEKLFGGNSIQIIPRGSVDIMARAQHNRNENPTFNETQRNLWGLDFDQNINLNFTGKIGERLNIRTNFNSRAQFDFENQIHFDYLPEEDGILRRLEVGNVQLALNTSLIQGAQSLFGVKAQFQIGKIMMTGLVSQQRSRTREITIDNGSIHQSTTVDLSNYEDNQHYFLAHYFRENYNKALELAPLINSSVNITQVELWISNYAGTQQDARDIVALMDLGEINPYNTLITPGSSRLPSSGIPGSSSTSTSNNLLPLLGEQGRAADGSFLSNFFAGTGREDNFVRLTYARRLVEGTDFTVNRRLGYISLKSPLQRDQALSASFRYLAQGEEYQVGEFSTDFPVVSDNPKALYTKLLKNHVLKTELPIWNLMMKNVYGLGTRNISEEDLQLTILRTENETNTERPGIYEGQNTRDKTWLQLTALDRITQQQARGADGIVDYIEGYTILKDEGKLIFPVLEPFGNNLQQQFATGEEQLSEKYSFPELYTHTKIDAQQLFPDKNRYSLRGNIRTSGSSEFHLGVLNINPESVQVMLGGMLLQPGKDYTIDTQVGVLRILQEALLLSGQSLVVRIEDDTMFGMQQKSLIGGRLDYQVHPSLRLGATFLRLNEKPLTEKVNLGEEPVSNSVLGADFTFHRSSEWLTRMVNKIPFLQTEAPSLINLYGEGAYLMPNVPRGLGNGLDKNGVAYIDDFETAVSFIDLKGQHGWQLSGTPRQFSESALHNDLSYGYNRALLSFYNIDPIFYQTRSPLNPGLDAQQLSDHRVREVTVQEVFPNRDTKTGVDSFLPTLDLAYYPDTRGPYNYSSTGVLADGTLTQPQSRWAGLFKKVEQTDFEAQNIEYLEMWIMDPTLTNPNGTGGDLYFNLGNISEDILKDGRRAFESGVPTTNNPLTADQTQWGNVVKNQPVIQAFDNDPEHRKQQDVGLDGLNDIAEAEFHRDFVQRMSAVLTPNALSLLQRDPSSDNYNFYIGRQHANGTSILERYKHYRGLEGNSRTSQQSMEDFGVENGANSLIPDGEDLNLDNTMNEVDEYYQYRFSTRPEDLIVGHNHIIDEYSAEVTLLNGFRTPVKWYKVRIPLQEYESSVGQIQDFKSIRFLRMFLTNYADTTVLRFARLQFVRGEWRKYNAKNHQNQVIVDPAMENAAPDRSTFEVANINVEENGHRQPIPYVVPPGINRQIDLNNNNFDVRLNEQALTLSVHQLEDGYGRAAFRPIAKDLRSYRYVEMFVHAEGATLRDGDARAFIRLGTDDQLNYYEYEIPLEVTPYGSSSAESIWPQANRFKLNLQLLTELKLERDAAARNGSAWPHDIPFEKEISGQMIRVVGAPDLSKLRQILLGVRNAMRGGAGSRPDDDGNAIQGEFWFNELRVTDYDDRRGWATTARMDIQLADFANISVAGSKSSIGWGAIHQSRDQRSRSEEVFLDVASNVELGNFFRPELGIIIPFYLSYNRHRSTPEFNPYYADVSLQRSLSLLDDVGRRDLLQKVRTYKNRSSFSFNNVRKIRTNPLQASRPWDIENWSLSYAFNNYNHQDFNTYDATHKTYRGMLDYNFVNTEGWMFQPFKKIGLVDFLKKTQFNLLPSLINFRLEVNRVYQENTLRDNSTDNPLPTLLNKNFRMNRIYGISWDITNDLRLDFNATNFAIIDEPDGRVDGLRRDTLWSNFWKMGRTTDYNQMMNITYTLPIHRIAYLEWLNLTTRYGTQFNWQSEPLLTLRSPNINIGNNIQNNRTIQVNPTLQLMRLYNKFGAFRRNNAPTASKTKQALNQLITSLRTVNASYLKTEGIFLPGYLPLSQHLGYDFQSNAPGWGFIFGSQGDILDRASRNGWLSTDSLQTQLYNKTYAENYSALIGFEPAKGWRIDLTTTRVDNYNLSREVATNMSAEGEQPRPYKTGNYSITQFGLKSFFRSGNQLFDQMQSSRMTISYLLAAMNSNSDQGANEIRQQNNQYADGYNEKQQQVLIAAFRTVFRDVSPNHTNLHAKPSFPIPNWRMNYNRLSALLGLQDWLPSMNINHSYQSEYSIGGYTSMLRYREEDGMPTERDAENNFLTEYQYNQISVLDRFVPLVGLDMRFANNISTNSEYRKTRNMMLSLSNSQFSFFEEESFILGMGYQKQNVKLPFSLFANRNWNHDVNFRVDIALQDRKTTIFRFDDTLADITAGNKSISVHPTLDFTVNRRYNVQLFYNSNVVRPYTSQTFTTSYTYFGFNFRILFQ